LKTYSNTYRILNKLNQLGLLQFFNFKVSCIVNKNEYEIPVEGGLGLSHLVQVESWMNSLLFKYRDEFVAKHVLDIGVNIGQTLLKLKAIAPRCSYIGFEPNPYCLSYLSKLCELNKLTNTAIIPMALSDTSDVVELLFDNDSPVDSSAGINRLYRRGTKRKINIHTAVPDELTILKHKNIGLIKIDVEGAELEVLNGLTELIRKNLPIIFIEILPVYDVENKDRLDRQSKIQKIIESLNYQIYRINEKTASEKLIKQFEIHGDLTKCNYILKPQGAN